jgi:hypothetical protein
MEMTFAKSTIAYSGLMVGSRLPPIDFEAGCFGCLIQVVGGLSGRRVGVLRSSGCVFRVQIHGESRPQNQAAKVLVLPRLARVASGP